MSRPPAPGPASFAAVDLGATSGRVMLGRVGAGTLDLVEAHRFPNTPVRLADGLYWDLPEPGLYRGVLDGLREAGRRAGGIVSVGVDSWAVDYGLLDADGALIGNPHHYRDPRTSPEVIEQVWQRVGASELYRITGLQHLPFNTVFQLAAERDLAAAETLLLIPDLVTYWLGGSIGAEETNASTTGLFDATSRSWSEAVTSAVGLDPKLLPPLRAPGTCAGTLLPQVAAETGLDERTRVTVVASHDTASAVAAVPARMTRAAGGFAYISCGTWSLAGVELAAPVLGPASRRANFTNELGVDGTVRYLRNIMGLWLLTESLRTWATDDLAGLLAEAAAAEPFGALVDPDDPAFLPPGDMPARIAEFCRRTGQRPPESRGATVRCILESLALAHRHTLRQAGELSGHEFGIVHLVGGGSRNELLCQWTADALGMPVIAGPTEATALGNVLVQARAHGLVGDLASMRELVADTQRLRRYTPSGDRRAWDAAAARLNVLC
ncbi:MAG TPA: rhamnulokinase family protein [Actinospica sp.]|jgi:rhamnulokinase|nr:rhamnulokinase family protein [Actinospica sp.]